MVQVAYPKISVVIPNFNMENYIEDTLKSIVKQEYPNLELIVIDGESTDNSLLILKKYDKYITHLISEADRGQYDAIQKGFKYATGDIYCWLNADDISFSWSFKTVASIFASNNNIKWLTGIPAFLNEDGSIKKIYNNASAKPKNAIMNGFFRKKGYGYLQQESMFWTKEIWDASGGLNLELKLAADYALWINFAGLTELWTVNLPLSAFRLRNSSRSKQLEEIYSNEVNIVAKSLKPLPVLFRIFGKNLHLNFLLRLIIWKRTKIIHQPFNAITPIYETRFRSVSSLSLSALVLEN
jgi:glycosyltransferase involved in cell wall biosynthesis